MHLSETCHEPDAAGRRRPRTCSPIPGPRGAGDRRGMTEPVHHALARRGLPPGEHTADSAVCQRRPAAAARARGITLLAPVPPDSSPQARSGGYAAAMFTIDWESKQVTCPQGSVSSSWTPARSKGPTHPGPVRQGDLPAVPGPGPVHHRAAPPPARLPAPPDPRGPHRRPRRAGQRRLAAEIPDPRRGGGTIAQATHVTGTATPATSAWAKPAWNTTPQPPPST